MVSRNLLLGLAQFLAGDECPNNGRSGEQTRPAPGNLYLVPLERTLLVDVEYQVIVVGQNRVGADVYGEDFGQQAESVLNVLLAGRIVLPRQRILAAQEVPADAAGDDVIERRDLERHQSFAGLWHELRFR